MKRYQSLLIVIAGGLALAGTWGNVVFAQQSPPPRPVKADEVAPDAAPTDEVAADEVADEIPTNGPAPADSGTRVSEPMEVNLSGGQVDVQLVGDSVIITANDNDLAVLQALIDRLDAQGPPRGYRVMKLKSKNAANIATAVQTVMRDMQTTERAQDEVTLSPLSNNIVVITGPESRLADAERLVATLDEEPTNLPEFEKMTFKLEHIKAAEAAKHLEEFLEVVRALQGDAPESQMKVVPISANNSVVVIGPAQEKEKLQQLIDEIDVEPAPGFGALKLAYFPLINSEAEPLAEVLNELLTSAAQGEEAAEETIRRLSMLRVGPDGQPIELPPIDLQRQIKIIADDQSQALICATSEENVAPLTELIRLLDSVPLAVEQGLRVFPLKYADATTIKELLDEMFEQGKELPRPAPGRDETKAVPQNEIGRSLVYNVSISADGRTNTLIVAGRPEQLVLVEGLVQQLDLPGTEIRQPLRLIALQRTDATQMATLIGDLWEKRVEAMEATKIGEAAIAREKVFVSVDLRTNSLIVSATEDNYNEILNMVRTLESAPNRPDGEIRLIPLQFASAGDLKSKIDELWQRKGELRNTAEFPQDLPVVVADQRSNTLVVASSFEDYEEIRRLVEQLEAQPLAPTAQIRLLTLKNNDAGQIGDMLKTLFDERMQQRLAEGQQENPSDRVAIAAEPATNTLLVASSPDNYAEISRIVEALDVEPSLEGVVRVFVLENAQAESVAERITDLFEQGLYTGVLTGDSQINEQRQKVAVVSDPRSNAVIASASKANLSIIERLIVQLDTSEAPEIDTDTRIFRLSQADPVKIADMLTRLFEGMASASESDFKAPTIVPDAMSGTLLVTGSRDAIKRVTELVGALDVKAEGIQRLIQVYPLDHASAVKLAARISDLFEQRSQGGEDTQRASFYVLADEPTNALIVAASPEDHATMTHLLDLLDVPSTISRQVEVFPLQHAKAEPTAQALEQLFQSQAQGAGGATGRADAIAVQPDPRTNSLIVWASASEMDNVARIVAKLDTTRPGPEMMVKVITLKRALAEDLKERLINTLNGGQQGGQGADEKAVILSYEEVLPDGTIAIRKLVRQDVTIEADPRTNSLFVMAPAGSMEMLEGFIQSIDRIPPLVQEIRMFPLANADAEEVVEVLESLFEPQTGGGAAAGEGPETRLQIEGSATGEATTPGQQLRFTANRRTNMVVAAGTETDLDMVERLVRELDAQALEERDRIVYQSKYVPAQDVATAIKDYFDQEDQLYSDLDDQTSAQRRIERAVTVVGDEKSNSVLLGVSPRNRSRTMEMLYAIDRPPPQVMIQVLIAEVQLDDSLEFGMEWALQDLLFSETAVVGPNGVVHGNNFDFVGGTDVGAAGAAGSFGGFSFAITGEDFSFLVRALQSDGSLEVLSRPTLLVENNEEANITIGDKVPFLRGSQVSDTGQVNSQVEYEEVGIILNVTPHINPDGYVNLEVAPEISALNPGSNVQISEGLTAPTFTNRSAETVVTVKDGETVVIGGLIQTQEDKRETKVPIVGDIPGVGNIFRATSNTRRRTELLMVLTVDVLWDEQDALAASAKLRDQSGFLPESVKRSPLMEGLRIRAGEGLEQSPLDDVEVERPVRRTRRVTDPNAPVYGPQPSTYGPKRPNGAAPAPVGPPIPQAPPQTVPPIGPMVPVAPPKEKTPPTVKDASAPALTAVVAPVTASATMGPTMRALTAPVPASAPATEGAAPLALQMVPVEKAN